jgi:hypothetical protein
VRTRHPPPQVARAPALLAVAAGARFTEAAHLAGRRRGDAVAHLVARCYRAGLAAPAPCSDSRDPQESGAMAMSKATD